MKNSVLYAFSTLLLLAACSPPSVDTNGFDIVQWRDDKMGCRNHRAALHAAFEQRIKPQLKGLSENQIIDLLGKSDRQELSRRNQKFYYYFIESGNQCSDAADRPEGKRLQIRFDAINQVNEVVIAY